MNLSNWSSDICCLCCPTIECCGILTGKKEFMVDGLPVNIGIAIVLAIISSSLSTSVPALPCTGTAPVAVGVMEWRIPWWGFCDDSFFEHGLPKTFSCGSDRFHASSGKCLSRLSIERGLGMTACWLEKWNCSTFVWFYLLKFSGIVNAIHPLLQFLFLWSESLDSVMTFSQLLCRLTCSTWCRRLMNSSIGCLWWLMCRTWICKNVCL